MFGLARKSRPKILFVVHSWGGGTIRFARELADLIADRVDVIWAWGIKDRSLHVSQRGPYFTEQSYDLTAGLDPPLRALRSFKLSRVNVIHTIGLQDHVSALVEGLKLPYDVTLTDYHHFSSAPHFEDERGFFIGDTALAGMREAAGDAVPPLLMKAERRIAISRDLAHRSQGFMPGLPVIPVRVIESQRAIGGPVKSPSLADGEAMRVLVLGRPDRAKGRATIIEVARRIHDEKLPVEITCLGKARAANEMALSSLPNVHVLGAYDQQDLPEIVAGIDPHVVWLPFTVPETHSYALSDATALGLPVLASGIGAIPERVMGRPSTWLVSPPTDAERHFQWIKKLYLDRMQTRPAWQQIDHLPPVLDRFYPDAYLEPVEAPRLSPLRWLDWRRRQ